MFWIHIPNITQYVLTVCLPFESFNFRFLDNLLLRDCQAMSRRCSCNQPSMKGRFRDFWESLDPSKKKDNFSSDKTYSLVKNRSKTFLQRFVQFVSRRAYTKLILGQQHEGDSGHVGFHHRKKFRRDLILTDGEVWLPLWRLGQFVFIGGRGGGRGGVDSSWYSQGELFKRKTRPQILDLQRLISLRKMMAG